MADDAGATVTDAGPPPPCLGPPPPPPTSVGFNYFANGDASWLVDSYDDAAVQATFARDLTVMASFGARVVRLMLFPYASGLTIAPDTAPGQLDLAKIALVNQHLEDAVARFAAHGIAVVIALGPNAYWWNGPESGGTWWEYTYGAAGWPALTSDLVLWSNAIIDVVEASPACSGVLAWDLQNEVDYNVPRMHELVVAQLAGTRVPDSKRAISLLHAARADELAVDVAQAGAPLSIVDFHSYPDRNHDVDIAALADGVRAEHPDALVSVGEFGGILCEGGESDPGQATTVAAVLARADLAGVAFALQWMLWDREDTAAACGPGVERTGLGRAIDLPRDAYGVLAARSPLGQVADTGAENGLAGLDVGGVVPAAVTLSRGGPSQGDAPVGDYYARMTAEAEGPAWLCFAPFAVAGDALALSGYLRASTTSLGVDVHFADAGGAPLPLGHLDVPHPAGWAAQNLQAALAGATVPLPAGAASARVCLTLDAPAGASLGNPVLLDVDAIAAASFASLP